MTPEQQAAYPLPPELSASQDTGTTVIATATASAFTDLNGLVLGRRFEFLAEADIYVSFYKDGAQTIDETATGTTLATPMLLKAGVPMQWILDPTKHRFLYTKAAAATPKLRIRPTAPR